jgi:hypothetical protein
MGEIESPQPGLLNGREKPEPFGADEMIDQGIATNRYFYKNSYRKINSIHVRKVRIQ